MSNKMKLKKIIMVLSIPVMLSACSAIDSQDSSKGNRLKPLEGRSFSPVFADSKRTFDRAPNSRYSLNQGNWAREQQTHPQRISSWGRHTDPSRRNNLEDRVNIFEAPKRYKYDQMNCFHSDCIQPEFLKKLHRQVSGN
ncbi:hypothetical protein [Neisseria zalophi]|uniref:Uncharacterized protein n=1 Tax=Neisseria zalophi TaxID=640030 RepID=A0A5J6PYY8_9NEIS|nr:hypothetical protein [Neisseria zalophi]QEY26067.1 hypothetical protein D0T92_05665 [Neisseria zalophi]